MRPFQLNLASRPFRNNTLVWAAYTLLLVAAASFTYWNVSSFRHYKEELVKLDKIQGNMDEEQRDLIARHKVVLRGVQEFDRASIGRRTSKANQVIEWKAFSWTRLFNRLEKLLPYNIKMTSVRPIFRERGRNLDNADPRRSMPVTIEGQARDWDAFFELENDLHEDRSFGHVQPHFMDKVDNGEVLFSIEFLYYPDELLAPVEPEGDVAGVPAEPRGDNAGTAAAAPVADASANEVTDEWAERAQPPDEAAQTPENEKKTAREPVRRALPKVEPSETEGEDEDPSR